MTPIESLRAPGESPRRSLPVTDSGGQINIATARQEDPRS